MNLRRGLVRAALVLWVGTAALVGWLRWRTAESAYYTAVWSRLYPESVTSVAYSLRVSEDSLAGMSAADLARVHERLTRDSEPAGGTALERLGISDQREAKALATKLDAAVGAAHAFAAERARAARSGPRTLLRAWLRWAGIALTIYVAASVAVYLVVRWVLQGFSPRAERMSSRQGEVVRQERRRFLVTYLTAFGVQGLLAFSVAGHDELWRINELITGCALIGYGVAFYRFSKALGHEWPQTLTLVLSGIMPGVNLLTLAAALYFAKQRERELQVSASPESSASPEAPEQ